MKPSSLVVISFLLASTAFAQTVKLVGLGTSTCKQFNQEVEQNFRVQEKYFAWAQGFMSAALLRAPPGVDEGVDLHPPTFPVRQQVEILRRFCADYPDKRYSDGVIDLYRLLRGKNRS
jgi:hypothetical protein